ncbi:lantibiotic dehydratase [Streptomyces hoynatensis]|uniref:Lantibiotic dehydratase n=1 Tax=Streptomyces hoynatensis TaxID=1141874 RepID=A0A3A9ZEA1_9ACTN|nr:lantibiotic dehydratase [Streptomyces hoynatensis]RKN46673.1 lantibiotic dehydratase [Streptomyces hoynatensis]
MARSVFRHQPVALARIPLRPAVPATEEETAGLLAEGIFLASRATAGAAGTALAVKEARMAATWHAYDIRSRTRPTPHGVFAGVASARFANQPAALRLGAAHRAVTTPSAAWLTVVADRLLDADELLPALTLASNNLVQRRGDRLEAEHPAPAGANPQRSSVRATPVALWLLDACQGGASGARVLGEMAERYPAVAEETIRTTVRQMIRTGFLLTDLLPTHIRADPLGHLLTRLPSTAAPHPALEHLRELLDRADALPPGAPERLPLLWSARDAADAIATVERPLTADTLADANLVLPDALGKQAAQAADLLWHVSQLASPATGYHEKFLRAYGRHRLVPLLEVIDPATGIGPPAEADNIAAQGDIDPRRAELLARLLAQATAQGQTEITVDDDLAARLSHGARTEPPPTAEIHVRLLRHGDQLRLAVCDAGSQDAGSAAGRFAGWLPQLAPSSDDAADTAPMVAEIVCRPRTGPTAALAVETGFAPHRIPLGVPPRKGDLLPEDLLVGSTGRHLVAWSARHRHPVRPVLFSRLASDLLPPAARTLRLIGHAGHRPWHTWSWGPAAYAPYTPRVRYRSVILDPARWRLPEDLTHAAAHRRTWAKALADWLTDAIPGPPDVVVVQESDRQIPLDLRRAEDRELLRRSVRRGARAVTEPFTDPDTTDAPVEGPFGRHVIELVINLTRRNEPPAPRLDPRARPRGGHGTRHLPGGTWLSAALPVPAIHQDTVLRQLPEILAPATEHMHRSFWLRYHTPALGDHLRIRVHGDPESLVTHVLSLLTTWSSTLNAQHLAGAMALEPYVPETERYGGPGAIEVAEDVFAADSAFAARCLALTDALPDRLLIAAVSAADIAYTVAHQPRLALRGHGLSAADRRTRDSLRTRLRTARPESASLIPAALGGSGAARHQTLTAYRAALTDPDVTDLCASDLIHMHCNRLLGPDPAHERITRSLATDLLHTHAHQH